MTDTRISAADLLRLAAIASTSPEAAPDEIMTILQRTGPAADTAPDVGEATDDADKLAKPE